jgi:hypothetical protein
MASNPKLTIRVQAARGSTKISYSTNGRYVSFTTAGLSNTLTKQQLFTTASLAAFWTEVIGLVQADITAGS